MLLVGYFENVIKSIKVISFSTSCSDCFNLNEHDYNVILRIVLMIHCPIFSCSIAFCYSVKCSNITNTTLKTLSFDFKTFINCQQPVVTMLVNQTQ